MYEATAALEPSLNGSVALPDYFFRNLGVAWSQLIRLEPREEGRAGAKQRAAAAFMRYLRFDTISTEDRTAVEQGVLSLIPTPLMVRRAGFGPNSNFNDFALVGVRFYDIFCRKIPEG